MKEKIIESIHATRSHFEGKQCSTPSYFRHLEKEFRLRDLNVPADELKKALKEKIQQGGFVV